jgi:predicted metalloprotease with PDZ domain
MTRRLRSRRRLVLAGAVCLFSALGYAQSSAVFPAIHYKVSLARSPEHLLHIEVELPAGAAQRQVQLPVWNALYQVRDFSQYVNWVRAKSRSGDALSVRKLDKTTWQIEGASDGAVLEYEMLAEQTGPYGAEINSHHAFFNFAEILMYLPDARSANVRLKFTDVPAGWKFATSLKTSGDEFQADNYDQLVDSPVEIGQFEESDFDQDGAHYRVVVDAERGDYDLAKITRDVRRIVAAATSWMQDQPYQNYVFLYHFPRGPGGGGMEHAYSTAIEVGARVLQDNPKALNEVTAHEFFHLWNVKRIRPQSLEPVDYTKENYTRALWFSEGVTSTVEDIILVRAGLEDEPMFLTKLGDQISELQNRPAHLTQSAEQASLDAWLEKYPEYRQPERSISYYNKGDLLGMMLDLAIRDASNGSASLRSVFAWMNENFARKGQYFADSQGVQKAAEAVSHTDLSSFFRKYVAGVEEIPWNDVFRGVGLQVVRRTVTAADLSFTAVRNFDAPPAVNRLTPGGGAERAGLSLGDAVLEINGRPTASDYVRKLEELRPGDVIHLRIRHHGAERQIQWTLASREQVEFALKDVENVSAQQRARRAAWLKGE